MIRPYLSWWLVLWFGGFLCTPTQLWAAPCQGVCEGIRTIRLGLLIGHNRAGGRAADLRYAELDARKVNDLLIQLGGYQQQHIWMLTGQPAPVLLRAMQSIKNKIKTLRTKYGSKARIVLFVYYSGHAQKGNLLLGDSTLPFRTIKDFMQKSGASLRLAVFDACESGALTQSKGLKRRREQFRFPFVRLNPSASGEVIISATGERESAHEDGKLHGGIFTHYFLSGLRGAADRNQDGHVTLEEAYLYSYNRSLERTILSSRGPQRARFAKKLSGYGSLVLTQLSKQRAWLQLRKDLEGEFFIWNTRRDLLLAEVTKNKGRAVVVALPPGRYLLQWRRRGGVYHKQIVLRKDQRFRLGMMGKRLAYWQSPKTRGGDAIAPQEGLWQSFQGQLVGPGLGVSYRMGFSGIDHGVLHHGPMLHFLLPLGLGATGRLSLLFQAGYQFGTDQINETLRYDLHLFNLDLGLVWTLLERPHWWLGAGGVLRGNLFVQQTHQRPEIPAESLLSFGFGAAGLLRLQYGFGQRWFVQASVLAGIRMLDLGGIWSARWDLETSLGFGIRI